MQNALLHTRRCATLCFRIRGKAKHTILRRTTGNERLLRDGLRHDLGFLIGHFWLLSEAFASLLF